MCNVCVAGSCLRDKFSSGGYDLRAEGKAEFGPARLQIKRDNEEWSSIKGWLYTFDLAGTVGELGFDTKEVSWKQKRLLKETYLALKTGNLYCTYPGFKYTHERLIWRRRKKEDDRKDYSNTV